MKIQFHKPHITQKELSIVSETIKSGWLTMGAITLEFEEKFKNYIRSQFAISVNSATAALHLALNAIGVEKGDEVIIPTNTFISTAEAVLYSGAIPTLCDIEGENPLYLSQAKIYNSSCSMGPCIRIDVSEDDARQWTIRAKIERDGDNIYQEEISVSRIKRSFTELINYLFQSQVFPYGVVLLTGTGLVPDDDFTLLPKDLISINITGIGTLKNQVLKV